MQGTHRLVTHFYGCGAGDTEQGFQSSPDFWIFILDLDISHVYFTYKYKSSLLEPPSALFCGDLGQAAS